MANVKRFGRPVDPVQERLAEPFDPAEVKYLPKNVSGNRCLAIPYVDARVVMERLDDVLGSSGWYDCYQFLAGGEVACTLSVKFASEWIAKSDVGGQSEQPDEGDRLKAAVSDALKRAAVKFGVGRYLYRLPKFWVDYDPQKKCIVKLPQLPDWAMPSKRPRNGRELKARLVAKGYELAEKKLCEPGAFVAAIEAAGRKHRFPVDVAEWDDAGIDLASREAVAFERGLKAEAVPAGEPVANGKR